ncbi:MAG: hypothetical protein KIT11_09135 [Fimbriimonadaceae bacterium]|nr:hypothetical protein [Fimbriimonadaceae bacterium]QYK55491.1 MAG: hypothetical protein KF733_10805 [Fimbriimonadaceae bacterium]
MASLAELLGAVGLGGLLGVALALYGAGKKLADEISEATASIDLALRDPRKVDLAAVLKELRDVEREFRTFSGLLKRLVSR